MQRGGGVMNADDLASYRAIEREPVRSSFRGYDIVSAPPPSSGGVHVSQILKLLEPYPIEEMGHNSAAYLHLLIESMKLAYADRSEYLGDLIEQRSPSKHLQVTLTSTGAVPLFKTTWPHLLRSSNREVLTTMRARDDPFLDR